MKELSIEEKAKCYDEAIYNNYKSFNELIERLESVKNVIKEHNYGIAMDILCKPYPKFQITTFTELNESEDERIRKGIYNFLYNERHNIKQLTPYTDEFDRWLAWLEKQGEQKDILEDAVLDSNKDGLIADTIRYKREKQGEQKPIKEHNICDTCDEKAGCVDPCPMKLVEQKPAEYTLEQAAGIFLDALSNTPYNNKPITDAQVITKELLKFLADTSSYNPNAINEQNPVWSKEDERIRQDIENLIYFALNDGSAVSPAANTTKEGAISWIQSLKDRIPSKQEWSEEDDKMINSIAVHLNATTGGFPEDRAWADKFMIWLKSLKERNTWKPSEAQIEALSKLEEMHVLEHEKNQENAHLYMMIKSIREQLLKLMEE